MNIGIKNIGIYIPKKIKDSKKISELSEIPEYVIREKFGIKKVHQASEEETVSEMGARAAKKALNGFDPEKLDLVVYCGSEYKDYYLYNCAADIQNKIGAVNANAFEIHSLCSAGVYSLKVLKSMMLNDKNLNNVLLVSSSKETQIIDYTNHNSRFMFNFGDGASAILLQRGLNENIILETAMITDGSFAEDVAVYGVGCKNFNNSKDVKFKNRFLDVKDINDMKSRLDPISFDNFNKVIKRSIEKSGYEINDINYLAPIFMKRSLLEGILEGFGLSEENSFVLEEYGHCQSSDAFISLFEGQKLNRLKDGDLAVLLGAGTGYTWAATAVKWGKA
ncbi:3-oxoacyl-ACP synthase [Senegalia massiliensis]|uniref:3-oxoacyl-ACP synthase n=1 Tax=Senegalia massiliensis TaxID=1720316 RepID=A0A845QYD9_9CLOT|nr:3-oxoacyl-ACP synthase [Senegalia massiliensis]NBI06162.1 3-oxoacyl-ACP synthase [Senegalia massiliensis]